MENYQLNNKFLKKISNLDRVKKQLIMAVFDSITVIIVLLASFSLSINYWYWPKNEIFWVIFLSPFIAIPVFFSFRLYRSFVRYIGFKALSSIIQAVTLYSVIWGLISLMSNHPLIMSLLGISADPFNGGSYYVGISRSVILINWMLALIIIGGSRLLVRSLFENSNFNFNKNKNKVIIYGAGSSGRELSQALQSSIEYKHVAYIDDDSTKDGAYMGNVPIFSYKKIEQIINKYNPSEILLALPSISVKKRKKIIEKLSLLNLNVRSMPSVTQLAEGKVKIDDLLEIDVKDLLGRKPIESDYKLLKIKIENKVVMVTGAGGSIGSEICRQIINLKPNQLILFDISEASLYQIEQEIININANIEIIPILGSVCSPNKLQDIFDNYRVATIYHAAAYKHVPLVESNKMEGILNNVIGTMTLAKSAISSNVETFVLISTDKAVRPTNTMGATKRASELILQALAEIPSNTCFTMVRFGNVLDSSGSVIPLFKKQIRKGGPITVTDANIVRYFMTIPEAVELVIQAGAMSEGGDVFVLDMGEPVRIYDLAVKMIRLSGLKVLDEKNPDGDIEIKYTGLRPGEKLYEELLVGDNTFETDNKLIMKAKEIMINWSDLEPMLIQLREAALSSNRNKSQVLLQNIVPEFSPKSN